MIDNEADTPATSERQGIQVIARAAALLRALQHRPEGMTLGELSKAVSLPRSTVQRLVDALDSEGFVLAASSTSGVRLGPSLLALAAATRFHIAEVARKTLESLAKETGETVDLSLMDQSKVVFIDQVAEHTGSLPSPPSASPSRCTRRPTARRSWQPWMTRRSPGCARA